MSGLADDLGRGPCRRAGRGSAARAASPRRSSAGTRPPPRPRGRPTAGRAASACCSNGLVSRASGESCASRRAAFAPRRVPSRPAPRSGDPRLARRSSPPAANRAGPRAVRCRGASRRRRAPGSRSASPCATRRCGDRAGTCCRAAWRPRLRARARSRRREHRGAVADRHRGRLPRGAAELRAAPAVPVAPCRAGRTAEWPSSHSTSNNMHTTGRSLASFARGRRGPDLHARLQCSKLGTPCSSSATISPSSTASVWPSDSPSARSSGKRDGRVVALPARERDAAALDDDDRAHAVPLHLVGPPVVVGRQRRPRRPRTSVSGRAAPARASGPAAGSSGGSSTGRPWCGTARTSLRRARRAG